MNAAIYKKMRAQSISHACLRTSRLLIILGSALLLGMSGTMVADNLAPFGSGIMGFNAAVDSNAGTLLFHAGTARNINDGDLTASVDDFSGGGDGGQGVSFVGVIWSNLRTEQITNLTLSVATFFDGGWFGPNGTGPGASGTLDGTYLIEPSVQVSTNSGSAWRTITASSDYLTALNGHMLPAA